MNAYGLARLLARMDDPDDREALRIRQTLTMTAIVDMAKLALEAEAAAESAPDAPQTDSVPRPVRAMVLVGAAKEDIDEGDFLPIVAGIVDLTVYEIEPREDSDHRWSQARAAYDPSGDGYVWREVELELDAEPLRRALLPTRVRARVEEAE